MAVCQFFLRGTCRFGTACKNEHPAGGQSSGFGTSSWNRPTTAATTTPAAEVPFTLAIIQSDLSSASDKPNWPLSSYAPAKYEPLLLAGLDESPDELRVKYVTAMKAGNLNEYLQYESSKIAAAEQVFANARANSTQAYEQAVKQSNANAAKTTSTSSAFGQASGSAFPSTSSAFSSAPTTTSAFGNIPTTSAFGSAPNLAISAFGNLSTPEKSAFASTSTPSVFASTSTSTPASAFTALTTTPSAFGKSAFGQPAFGQPAFGQTGFGNTTTPAPASAFSQPQNKAAPVSAFGQPIQAPVTSAFGTPATTSAFGQPSFGQTSTPTSSVIKPASGAFSAFAGTGASPFGSTAVTTTTPTSTPAATNTGGGFSAFAGAPSAFGSTATTTTSGSVFGQPSFGQPVANTAPSTTTSVFGTPNQGTGTSVFGTPSGFGALAQQPQNVSVFGGGGTTSVFGTPTPPPAVSAFSQIQSQPQTSAFGGGSFGSQAPVNEPTVQPTLSVFAATQPSMSMEMKSAGSQSASLDFLSLKNVYKPDSTPYDQVLPPNYEDLLPQYVIDAFTAERFEWGSVPEWVPPIGVR